MHDKYVAYVYAAVDYYDQLTKAPPGLSRGLESPSEGPPEKKEQTGKVCQQHLFMVMKRLRFVTKMVVIVVMVVVCQLY